MSWARLDDGLADHPKIVRAGNSAVGCWVRCLSLMAKYRTDGFVDATLAARYGTPEDHDALVRVGLWIRVQEGESVTVTGRRDTGRRRLPDVQIRFGSDGFFVRDFLQYNLSRDELSRGGPHASERSTGSCVTEHQSDDALMRAQMCSLSRTSAPLSAQMRAQMRAQMCSNCARVARAIPTQPNPTQPTPNRPCADARADARAEAHVGVVPELGGAEFDAEVAAVAERLLHIGWRSKTRSSRRFGVDAWNALVRRIVGEQSLTVPDVNRLWSVAQQKSTKDPAQLFGAWVHPDGATWKDVLADQDARDREAALRHRAGQAQAEALKERRSDGNGTPKTLRDIGPIFGEEPT